MSKKKKKYREVRWARERFVIIASPVLFLFLGSQLDRMSVDIFFGFMIVKLSYNSFLYVKHAMYNKIFQSPSSYCQHSIVIFTKAYGVLFPFFKIKFFGLS